MMIVLPQQPIDLQKKLLASPINLPSIRHHIRQHSDHSEHIHHNQHQHQHHQSPNNQIQRRQSTMPSSVERLPLELQQMIFSNLNYQSLIFMSMTNRHFNQTVKPQEMADPIDKFQFVMHAANNFEQHRPKEKEWWGNFECYICYRVRSQDHFDALQSLTAYFDSKGRLVTGRPPGPGDTLYSLRRFCIDCGIKEGLHAPYDSLTTRRGDDLWVCLCRRVRSKPGCMRCKRCGADCPLRPKQRWSPY